MRTGLLVLSGSLLAVALAGQDDSARTRFLEDARLGTAKYRDPSRALADGYRPMGPETPAMGQHWVHLGILVADRVDPAAPAILEYATVKGVPELVGIAFAVPLDSTESPPDTPLPAAFWHTHRGTLADEGLSGSHAGMSMGRGERVAVLHAWVWLPNPAGTFEAENWLLPLAIWVRGFAPPK